MKKIIRIEQGWQTLTKEDDTSYLDLEDIINWYYQNYNVYEVHFLSNGTYSWAYVTIEVSDK